MKNRSLFICVGMVLLFSILACTVSINNDGGGGSVSGSGTAGEENRNVSNITGVQLAMQGTLYITMGDSESLRVEADDNLLQYIQTDVSGGMLTIQTRQGINLHVNQPIKYFLSVKKLNSIVISSSGNIETGSLQSDSFSVRISSSGDLLILSLECKSLEVKISSSGNLDINGGQVQQQDINISSSGEYRAKDLASAVANVTLTSSGAATIRVSDQLTGSLSSSGNVYYFGNPNLNINTTSSGKAIKKQ